MQRRARARARVLAIAMLVMIVVVSLWTPLLSTHFTDRWFAWPSILLLSPMPVLVALVAWGFWRGLAREHHLHAVPLRAGVVRAVLRRARH